MLNTKPATFFLEDGTKFVGFSFGANTTTQGEVVFNTAMVGYPESLSDPSYSGQVLVLTSPLVGNYGVPPRDVENGILKFFESDKIHISGLIVTDYAFKHSHWNSVQSLDAWLKEYDVPGVYGVDTRAITKILREKGEMRGVVSSNMDSPEFDRPVERNLVRHVSTKKILEYGVGNEHRVTLVDCGCKNNIIRSLVSRNCHVVKVPWDYDFNVMDHDGILLSNGPGDPNDCDVVVNNVKKAFKENKPIFGICLGNQILSRAAGGKTFKMKYGHRSHNQPVVEAGTNRAFITSQNHSYAVDHRTISGDWEPYFLNLNDNTIEGIRHKSKPFSSVQFHPEACGGPVDSAGLFDRFVSQMVEAKDR